MNNLLYELKGNGRTLLVYEEKLIFQWATDKKVVDMVNVESVEFSPASMWTNGYLSVGIKGEIKNSNGVKGAVNNLSSVIFFPKLNKVGEEIYNYLKQQIERNKKPEVVIQQVNNVSPADELRKYKELLDDGIITQDEFDAKKKQILGI